MVSPWEFDPRFDSTECDVSLGNLILVLFLALVVVGYINKVWLHIHCACTRQELDADAPNIIYADSNLNLVQVFFLQQIKITLAHFKIVYSIRYVYIHVKVRI
jgi:hypothetical protein